MSALQHDSLVLNPNGLALENVATYTRRIAANEARVWENVLDWEHLPHLHDSSFSYCELDAAGPWGWRVWSDVDHSSHIELCVDSDKYVTRSYSGGQQFSEIWTYLSPQRDYTDIRVEFFSTGVDESNQQAIGDMYLALYDVLWSEDEEMMRARQSRLDQQRDRSKQIVLGRIETLRAELPLTFELGGKEYVLSEDSEGWKVQPTLCPHMLGPLGPGSTAGYVRCPWHGYVFELSSGECVEPPGVPCKLGTPPEIIAEGDSLRVVLP